MNPFQISAESENWQEDTGAASIHAQNASWFFKHLDCLGRRHVGGDASMSASRCESGVSSTLFLYLGSTKCGTESENIIRCAPRSGMSHGLISCDGLRGMSPILGNSH